MKFIRYDRKKRYDERIIVHSYKEVFLSMLLLNYCVYNVVSNGRS